MIPILAVLACIWLMLSLSVETWLRFVVWMVVGLVVYLAYGRSHSLVGRREKAAAQAGAGPGPAESDTGG